MSILIKGIEMPKNCKECFACKAELSQEKKVIYVCCFAQTDCPLVTVPLHGRCIDADRMQESIKRQAGFLKLMGGKLSDIAETLEKGFLQEIANAPTIIPAEEGE